jgi:hypothetical protein
MPAHQVTHHAVYCSACGLGQTGDRGLHKAAVQFSGDAAAIAAAHLKDIEEGRAWDGRTLVTVKDGEDLVCPGCAAVKSSPQAATFALPTPPPVKAAGGVA